MALKVCCMQGPAARISMPRWAPDRSAPQALPSAAVTVVSEAFEGTTSHGAGGLWKPYTLVRLAASRAEQGRLAAAPARVCCSACCPAQAAQAV